MAVMSCGFSLRLLFRHAALAKRSRFIKTLEYLCKREGILFKTQEESYTSKASFLDNDFIPVYNPASKQTEEFSGRRDKRLYC